ncbi:MAG: carbohydrate kinase family protein [Candidatus Daviesbacteria bacterium]|nr:carbohydrate kinase family protein [Candidatus Daviesbacteria bacterium]
MKKRKKIILCGSIAIDRIMNFSGKYKDLFKLTNKEILSISVFLSNLKNNHGGVGANIAYTLALLGEKPILVGSVGKEAEGYLEKLSALGIDTRNIHRSLLETASFNVITDSANNQIGGFYPGAMFDSDSQTLNKWAGKDVLVVISPHDPKAMKRQIEECFKNKFQMFYDIGQQVLNTSKEDLIFGLSKAQILILNEFEMKALCSKTKNSISSLKSRIPLVITTLGEEGSIIEGKNISKKIRIKSVRIDEVVDPTGAGDAYRAGFLYGFARDWDLKTCGQMGSLAASCTIAHHGTQEHLFTKEEFSNKYEDCFEEKLLLI